MSNQHLVDLIKKMSGTLFGFIDNADVPEPNCSCHISPPCDDCVDYSLLRELISEAKDHMKEAETITKH